MKKRFRKTLRLLDEKYPSGMGDDLLLYDLGCRTEMSRLMAKKYFVLNNITDIDFDVDQDEITELSDDTQVTTSFEVFEHLLNPYAVLKAIKSEELLCSVPLRVWFSRAYWRSDKRDRHFHEFERRQFLWLLDATGWDVLDSGVWYIGQGIGIRPFLRLFFPSYFWVHAKRR